jgi:hypothetical protein
MEFILRHDRHAALRAGPNGEFLTEVKAGDPEALELVFSLIDEVLEYHGPDEWFHIGGDEPWYLREMSKSDPAGAAESYRMHMAAVANHVASRGKRPMLWDDFIRHLPGEERARVLAALPRGAILCLWDYGSSIRRKSTEWAGVVAEYREAGFGLVFVPCYNWGSGLPYYRDHTIANTLFMIDQAQMHGALGIINSAWACFRVPMPLADLGAAITGTRAWRMSKRVNARSVETAYCRLRFGLGDRRLADVLVHLAGQIEVPSSYGRPVNVPHYYYMDSVVQFGGQERRLQMGPSLDLYGDADYPAILEEKIRTIRESPLAHEALEALRLHAREAAAAIETLRSLDGGIRGSREVFDLLLWMAEFKEHSCRRMEFLIQGEGDPAALSGVSRDLEARLRKLFPFFLHEQEIDGEVAALFGGEGVLLAKAAAEGRGEAR